MTATYTYDVFSSLDGFGAAGSDPWVTAMVRTPATIVSSSLAEPLAWPDATLAAGLVDTVQVTLFPVITGTSGLDPIFAGAADFDLELVAATTLDGHIQELTYRPHLHGSAR